MRIGIEANALKNQAGTGVLAHHLTADLLARGHEVIEFSHGFSSKGEGRRSSWRRWMNGLRQVFWTQVTLPLAAARRRVDVLLCPAYVGPLLSPVPLVLMVLDLTFLIEPQTGDRLYMRYLQLLVPSLVKRARRVVTISQSAAAEIARLLPSAAGKVDVAYPGPGTTAPALPSPANGGGKYVLMVGTLEPRKNYPRAIQAFALFRNQGFEDWQLLIAGGSGWAYDDIGKEIDRLGLADVVKVVGQVPAPTLSTLYRDAGALFYPSLYEGFGFPILEAMAAGCPVVTSNRSSMAELGDGAVQLVDPLDRQSMAAGLSAVAGDAARRAELVARGRLRVREFSWERFAGSVERALEAAAKPGRA
ncbi:MAG TPA: glycosyltransferase family 1 protein [Candidatus Dormibacteraeota bacterium]|nr:glycosyltransferase family 1 protein [Candidatus Dormibacteraeota bacterium]